MGIITVGGAVRIVGCGRWSMGDDQVGLVVADRLAQRNIPDTEVNCTETPGSELATETSCESKLLVIIDAAPADRDHPAGTFEWIDYIENPGAFSDREESDTHGLGLHGGLKLAGALGLLPENVWICAIFASVFQRGLELSGPVAASVDAVVDDIEQKVREWVHNYPGKNPSKSHL